MFSAHTQSTEPEAKVQAGTVFSGGAEGFIQNVFFEEGGTSMMLKAPVLPITFGGQKTTGPRRLAAAAGIAALTALSMPYGAQAQTTSQFAEPGNTAATSLKPSSTDPALNTRIRLEPIRLAIIGLHVLLGVPILPSININGPVSPPATPPALSDPAPSGK